MNTTLRVSQLMTPLTTIPDGVITWNEDGKILYAGAEETAPQLESEVIETAHMIAAPGFIDIHVHGGFGIAFGSGDLEKELSAYSKQVARYGVTSFILTITGPNEKFILQAIESYVPLLEKEYPEAQPLGLHLEGPFLNPEKHGAFDLNWIRPPSLDEMRKYLNAGKGWIRHVTLAPELENAIEIAKFLTKNDVQPSLGHSNTDYETARKALIQPFTHVTHTYNAQSGLHHRSPGVVGAVLTSKTATAELIADAVHVHPATMRILVDCLGKDRICLITDAMPGAGLPDGTYELLNQKAFVKDGTARLADGIIAGSTATMDKCVRNMVQLVGVPIADAVKMATLNPAKIINAEKKLGSLVKGKKADIAVFNRDFQMKMTIKNGKIVSKE